MTPSDVITWEELKEHIYFENGSLRDIYIKGMGAGEWKSWADFVNSKYPTNFTVGELDLKRIDFEKVKSYWADSDGEYPTVTFFIGHIEVRGYFWDKEELENDFKPSDIGSMAAHLLLVAYLTEVSKLLNKSIELTEEKYSEDSEVLMVITGGKIDFPWRS
jgi:hypothetical protein